MSEITEIYTDEFIKLASLIQEEIEPKDAQYMWAKPEDRKGVYRVRYPIYYQGTGSDYVLVGVRRSYGKDQIILLPSLSWLVRKLRESRPAVMYDECRLYFNGEIWVYRWGEDYVSFEGDNTPELACLRALCKIKGIADV